MFHKVNTKEMKKIFYPYILITGTYMLFLSGCSPNSDYLSYEDQKKKGEVSFHKDFQFCKIYSNENTKRNEGSKGAGELAREKKFKFLLCMKNNFWTLKA